MPRLLKVVVGVAALGVLAVLFVRSAQSSRETPFTVEQGSLAPASRSQRGITMTHHKMFKRGVLRGGSALSALAMLGAGLHLVGDGGAIHAIMLSLVMA